MNEEAEGEAVGDAEGEADADGAPDGDPVGEAEAPLAGPVADADGFAPGEKIAGCEGEADGEPVQALTAPPRHTINVMVPARVYAVLRFWLVTARPPVMSSRNGVLSIWPLGY